MKMQYPMGLRTEARPSEPAKTLAMAYIVDQAWRDLYDIEQGFPIGTIFRELDFPYTGRRGEVSHAR